MKAIYKLIMIICVYTISQSLYAGVVEKHKEIYCKDKASYREHQGGLWTKGGRIIGMIKNPPPDLTVEFYSVSRGKIVDTFKIRGKINIYFSKFLPPGLYKVTFKATGYALHVENKVRVKKGFDTIQNVVFGTRVFTNR